MLTRFVLGVYNLWRTLWRPNTPQTPAHSLSGPSVWVCCTKPGRQDDVFVLAKNLFDTDMLAELALSLPQSALEHGDEDNNLREVSHRLIPLPPDDRKSVRAFLAHWSPGAIVFYGPFPPMMMHEAAQRGIPLFWVDALLPPYFTLTGWACRKGLSLWASRGAFRYVLALTARTQYLLQNKFGLSVNDVGQIEECPPPPEYDEKKRAALALQLSGRPAWLAVGVRPYELPAIIQAHRYAQRVSHRLLLILVPDSDYLDESNDVLETLSAHSKLTVAAHRVTKNISDNVDILLIDTKTDDIGLWYLMASICFLGGSLPEPSQPEPSHAEPVQLGLQAGAVYGPQAAAALGSALICGPLHGQFSAQIARFSAAGALRLINDATALGPALSDLLSPDQSAHLATCAWKTLTEGTERLDLVVESICATLAAPIEDGLNAPP